MLFARLHGRTHSGESRTPVWTRHWAPSSAFPSVTLAGVMSFIIRRAAAA
jgi:hypothetical protein